MLTIVIKTIFLLTFFPYPLSGLFPSVGGEKAVEAAGVMLNWEISGDTLCGWLTSPGKGWVAVGFNSKNELKGANLLMFAVSARGLEMEDRYIVAPGEHHADRELGGEMNITFAEAESHGKGDKVFFKIPLDSGDPYDHSLREGMMVWVILAWSREDDFGHHSAAREHVQITL